MKKFIALNLLLCLFLTSCSSLHKVEFEVSRFDTTETVSSYSTNYEGEGTIKTESEGIYNVVMLVEEKNSNGKDEYYYYVLVVNGEGEFETYDYVSNDEKEGYEKPEYEFTIVGYTKYKEIDN